MKKFISGFLCGLCSLIIFPNVASILNQLTELICTNLAIKTVKLKENLEEEPQEETFAIGFNTSPSEDYEEEEKIEE